MSGTRYWVAPPQNMYPSTVQARGHHEAAHSASEASDLYDCTQMIKLHLQVTGHVRLTAPGGAGATPGGSVPALRLCCLSLLLSGQMLPQSCPTGPRSCPLLPCCPGGSARPRWLPCRRRRLWRELRLTRRCMERRPSALGLRPRCLVSWASAAHLQHPSGCFSSTARHVDLHRHSASQSVKVP